MGEEQDENEQTIEVHKVSKDSNPEQAEQPKTFDPQPITPEFIGKPAKKRKVKKWVIIISILLVLVIVSGAGAYYFYGRNIGKKQTNKTAGASKVVSKSKTTSSLMPSVIIGAIQKAIMAKYPSVITDRTKVKGNEIVFKKTDAAPYWKIDGAKNYVNYTGDGGSRLETYFDNNTTTKTDKAIKSEGADIVQAIIGVLNKDGFIKSTNDAYSTSGSKVSSAYIKDDVICVASSLNDESVMNVPIWISCGLISKYTKNLDNYKETEPYAKAYVEVGKMHIGDILSFSSLKAGMNDYKNASVNFGNAGEQVGGFMGLFYKAPTGDWIFFEGTQQILACTSYNTKDLQYAFAYESCYDSTKTGDDANNTVASFYK